MAATWAFSWTGSSIHREKNSRGAAWERDRSGGGGGGGRERAPHLAVADAVADAVGLLAVVVGLHRGEPRWVAAQARGAAASRAPMAL